MPSYWEGTVVRLLAVEPGDWEIHHERDQDSARKLPSVSTASCSFEPFFFALP